MTVGMSPLAVDGEKERELLEVPARLAAAWSDNDAAGVAGMFLPDGVLIWPGVVRTGRAEIRDLLTTLFAGSLRGSGMRGTTVDVRFTTGDVALLRTHDTVVPPDAGQPEYLARTTWVCVHTDGEWRLAGFQNTVRGDGAALPGS